MPHWKHEVDCEDQEKVEMLIHRLIMEFTQHIVLPVGKYVFEIREKQTGAAHFYDWEHELFMQEREGNKISLFKISASQNHLPDRVPCGEAARHPVNNETESQKKKRRKTSTREHYLFIQGSEDGIKMWGDFVDNGTALDTMAEVCGGPVHSTRSFR